MGGHKHPGERLTQETNIAIIGSGSWGATLSVLFAGGGLNVRLYSRSPEKAARLQKTHLIESPLRIELPPQVTIFDDLAAAVDQAHLVILVCTSQSTRSVASQLAKVLGKETIAVVSAVKGLELTTSKRMSEVVAEFITDIPICSLSGPNLAGEILAGLPAASVVACKDVAVAANVQKLLSVSNFRVYSNEDLIGVELGGTLKNVIAIAAGVSDGLKLGSNAKSALLTRGLAEMTRLAVGMGAKAITLAGLAGMGDLFATCAGPASRNYRLGMELAQGKPMAEILHNLGAIAEGVTTAEAVCELSKQLGLELPIAEQVNAILKGISTPKGAIMTLMGRPPSTEY